MVRVAILHEGNEGKAKDNWLLKHLISELELDEKQFQFYGVGGKSNFFKLNSWFYPNLQMLVQEDQISKLLFVIDADYSKNDKAHGGYDNVLKVWQETVAHLGLAYISDIYITCDPRSKDGYLESLLLSTLDDEKVTCIQNFLNCSDYPAKEHHKSILYNIYNTAYPNAPYNFRHPHFDELKTKLRELVA
jgi:hypothetical protein